MEYRKTPHSQRFLKHLFTVPFIWAPLPFFLVLDIVVEIYHRICFPLYGIPFAKRSEYIQVFDRAKLQYLDPIEKLGCIYCGYSNGLLLYLKEISGRTEKYWCGIMHAKKPGYQNDPNHINNEFTDFDDADSFIKKYPLQ